MYEEKVLEEIYQNANTGIYSIDTILHKVEDRSISSELCSHQAQLERIAHAAEQMMIKKNIEPENGNAMSKMGIWTGVQLNSIRDSSTSHIADMVIQGDTMGITKMTKEMNQCPVTDEAVRDLGEELINSQRRNIESLKKYL